MIHDITHRIATDPMWPQLAAAILATLGLALTVLAYTAWSHRT